MSETGNGDSSLITAIGLVHVQFRSTGCLKEEDANKYPSVCVYISMCAYRHILIAKSSWGNK